ncbi:MAG: UDP-2,4-diacetamido-2,4,6-trideoxy-beta-L-altropyranose hydrolase [Burkholderiales bacterium]
MRQSMRVVFRADAALQMGVGHVMRCLTLAQILTRHGAQCEFLCREHPGNLITFIRAKGFPVHALPVETLSAAGVHDDGDPPLAHGAGWLGTSQRQDAAQCAAILSGIRPDWLIVDHYALDVRWEEALSPYYSRLMVIDDLADRLHLCNLLLDQNLGREREDYVSRVPDGCVILCGPKYALLRPEFAALRDYSLERRRLPAFERLLITMGGTDNGNVTGKVLQALQWCNLPPTCSITVVMGATAPWLSSVQQTASQLPWPVDVRSNVDDIATLMAESDAAIGAAGATTWERCCLGLPSIVLCLADNQRFVTGRLRDDRIALTISQEELEMNDGARLRSVLNELRSGLSGFIDAAARVTDGSGCEEVVRQFRALQENNHARCG